MNTFFVEITDTFGGEANYSWVIRHKVTASTVRGAISKVSRSVGIPFRKTLDTGELTRYDSPIGCFVAFVESWHNDSHSQYNNLKTI